MKYFNIYFLKPFDAINDTVTSNLVGSYDWSKPYLEIGSGDGMFSYIMHGGYFPLKFDRYINVDLNKKDIFDTKHNLVFKKLKKIYTVNNLCSVDAKKSHVEMIDQIQFSKKSVLSKCETLPFLDNSFDSIFLYTPHGISDYNQVLSECYRVLSKSGRLIVLNFSDDVNRYFISYKLKNFFKKYKFISNYFKKLDNGRAEEIKKLSNNKNKWVRKFNDIGFEFIDCKEGLSGFAWSVYDIQTRPVLKFLIKFFNLFPLSIRTFLKFTWIIIWFPFLVIFYLIFANSQIKLFKKNCYYCFDLKK